MSALSVALQTALDGPRGSLDAWLETVDENELKAAIRDLQSPQETLRDYFAAKAMHAELMTCGVPGKACDALVKTILKTGETAEAHMARVAYEMADAMLAAREQVRP